MYLHQYTLHLPWAEWRARARRYLLVWLTTVIVVTAFLANAYLASLAATLPSVESLKNFEPSETTRIYASGGELIGTLFRENRTWVELDKISPWMVKAIVATEDSRFWTHSGVDVIGVARAAVAPGRQQGASTITMQLARNLFLSPERSINRKLKEILLAQEIERKYTKSMILELYLNQIYFGSGSYGVQAAASQFFGRPASKLTPAQAAMLAGLPKSPSELSPFENPGAARDRQCVVLGRMLTHGDLTWKQYTRAMREAGQMKFKRRPARRQLLKFPYFTAYVIRLLSERYSEELLYTGGLNVYTTLDVRLQEQAEETVRQLVAQDESYLNVHQAALVTLENKTGFVRAMVGGRGFTTKNQFNRAWQARRQVGSSFKPIVYTTALENGMTPTTVVDDSPVEFKLGNGTSWKPQNSDSRSLGKIPLWKALQESRNVVAARLTVELGPDRIVDMAERMGIAHLQPLPSIALGTAEVSPLQMAATYSIFANGGLAREPVLITRVLDHQRQVLEDRRSRGARYVLAPQVASTMAWMLHRAANYGTGGAAVLAGHATAGKTGTTDSSRDTWFCGFTGRYTTAVWTGNDDYSRMWGAFGGNLPARIFRRTMEAAHAGKPEVRLPRVSAAPPVGVAVCSLTHQRATPYCPKRYNVSFDPALVTQDRCPKHTAPQVIRPGFGPGGYPTASPSGSPAAAAPVLELHEAPEVTPSVEEETP